MNLFYILQCQERGGVCCSGWNGVITGRFRFHDEEEYFKAFLIIKHGGKVMRLWVDYIITVN